MGAQVTWLAEKFDTMTLDQGMAFIERSRRQIARLKQVAKEPDALFLDMEEIARAQTLLNEVEEIILATPDYRPKST